MTLFVNGGDVLAGSFGEKLLLLLLARLLKLAECGGVAVALAAEAGFLNAEVVELALIGEEGPGFDEVLADGL